MSVTQLPAEPPPVVGYRAPEGVSPFKLFEVLWRRRGTLVFVACLVGVMMKVVDVRKELVK